MPTQLKRQLLANQLNLKIRESKEDQFQQAVSDFFKKQMNLVLTAFDEYYNEVMLLQGHINLILSPIHEMHQEYYDLLLEYNLDAYNRGRKQAERLVNRLKQKHSLKAVSLEHDGDDKYTKHFGTIGYSEDHLSSYTFTASEKTMSRVDGEINKILTTGYQEGWGVKDVRNRIQERYGQFTTWEANRIARTEMQTAHNMGMMNQYQEMGVKYKEWRSAHDKRVRTSHIYMDGEIAPLDEKFSNGLMYPGDKSGKIREWINCRCSVMPYLGPTDNITTPIGQRFGVDEHNVNQLLKEHTGGALDWEQYKQVLQGKTIEQIGIILQSKRQEEIYEEPSAEFTKWIDYIREGNWKDPEKMLEKIESLGYRKTNKLTESELVALQYEAMYYYQKSKRIF